MMVVDDADADADPDPDPEPPGRRAIPLCRRAALVLPIVAHAVLQLGGVCLGGLGLAAPGSDSHPEWDRIAPTTEPQAAAIRDGLASLLAAQDARTGRVGDTYPVAETALAGLAVLGAGYLPDQPPHGAFLRGCVRYLLGSADPTSGYMAEIEVLPESDAGSRMHGHAYAVLFLTQVLGSLPRTEEAEVRRAIERGVRVIERAQSTEGGWYYHARNSKNLDEASVTICAVQSLRAARDAGFAVDASAIDRGIAYVRRSQKPDGSVRYSLQFGRDDSTFALTAAAAATLNAAGVYGSKRRDDDALVLRRALDHLARELAGRSRHPEKAIEDQFFYYGLFYTTQAFWQEGGEVWEDWYPRVRDNLLSPRLLKSDEHGVRWETYEGPCRYGRVYANAVALLVLELPLGYLPIFQR